MIGLYRLLFIPALVLSLPYYLRRMFKRGGYAQDFAHRFGALPELPPPSAGRKRLWIQAVSVGEMNAIAPLVRQLAQSGWAEVVLTTTTSTGYTIAKEKLAQHCRLVGLFPVDFWLTSARAWKRIKPDAVVLMEGELWPEHCHQARKRGVPIYLINARLSDRSFRRYQKFPALARAIVQKPKLILASTEQDAERFRKLGAPSPLCSGNMKFDVATEPPSNTERQKLLAELGFIQPESAECPLILLGSSTWAGEEAMLLRVFEKAQAEGIGVRLLLVPRHAERRGELVALLQKQPHAWHQRSLSAQAPQPVNIVLADTTGELTRLSSAADVAFVGKSLPPHEGGQTPIEAAALGVALVYGPAMSNFKEICQSLEREEAAIRVSDEAQAEASLLNLLRDRTARTRLAQNAQTWHSKHKGATAKVLAKLASELNVKA